MMHCFHILNHLRMHRRTRRMHRFVDCNRKRHHHRLMIPIFRCDGNRILSFVLFLGMLLLFMLLLLGTILFFVLLFLGIHLLYDLFWHGMLLFFVLLFLGMVVFVLPFLGILLFVLPM